MSNSFYREIINEHNLRPIHKHILPRAGLSHRGINPSCGDDITLQLTIKDGVIAEGAYVGDGCAISQAQTRNLKNWRRREACRISRICLPGSNVPCWRGILLRKY